MSAVALGVATALVALRCQLITDDPYVLGSVSRVLPATRPAFLRALNQTRRLVGCPVDGDVQEPSPPFLGGQCPVAYRFTWQQRQGSTASGFSWSNNIVTGYTGPLRVVDESSGDETCPGEGQGFARQRLIGSGVNQDRLLSNGCSDAPPGWRLISLVRTDGQPDDCGDAPGVYPEPTDFTTNIDVTYDIDNTQTTVNIPFVFAPITANFDGSLRIPFSFDFGGFEFSGDINLPDFDVTIEPPGLPPGSGEDLSGEGEDQPGETVPPAPPNEKIIGVVVTATQIDSRRVSSYSSPGITPIFVPRLGSIKFAYSIGAATFFSSDIDIKDRRTFIPCPFIQGADAVIASPNLGVNLTFTPIRGYGAATTRDVLRPL